MSVEKNFRGNDLTPQVPTHRLSPTSTKDENIDFEVLFISGSTYDDEEPDKFTRAENDLSDAINDVHGEHCKKIDTIPKPTLEELEEKFKAIAERLKENNTKKLYIFFNGHGDREGIQEGVSKANQSKQGAANFIFVLSENTDLEEDKIKELYNKYFKDIEVVTVFGSCHSGAGITAIENNGLKNQLNVLA